MLITMSQTWPLSVARHTRTKFARSKAELMCSLLDSLALPSQGSVWEGTHTMRQVGGVLSLPRPGKDRSSCDKVLVNKSSKSI